MLPSSPPLGRAQQTRAHSIDDPTAAAAAPARSGAPPPRQRTLKMLASCSSDGLDRMRRLMFTICKSAGAPPPQPHNAGPTASGTPPRPSAPGRSDGSARRSRRRRPCAARAGGAGARAAAPALTLCAGDAADGAGARPDVHDVGRLHPGYPASTQGAREGWGEAVVCVDGDQAKAAAGAGAGAAGAMCVCVTRSRAGSPSQGAACSIRCVRT